MVKILKAAPGLDQTNLIQTLLGSDFQVIEYDPEASLVEQGQDADVLLLRDVPVPASVIDGLPKLKLLQRLGHHIVGVDIRHARKKGVYVANIPAKVSGGDRMVAEHALHLMFALAKRAKESQESLVKRILANPANYSLTGKTLALVGVGNTGGELARLVSGLDMRIVAVKRTADEALARQLGLAFMGTMLDIDKVLREADYVSLHMPLDDSTVSFFSDNAFAAMKKGAFLINVARAQIVDRAALERALDTGHLGGAGLDVFWEEPADPTDSLLNRSNVIVTPHVAGVTRDVYEKLAEVAVENIRLVLAGKSPRHAIEQ